MSNSNPPSCWRAAFVTFGAFAGLMLFLILILGDGGVASLR